MFRFGVLTVSDSAFRGLRTDEGGPAVEEVLSAHGFRPVLRAVVPDDRPAIARILRAWADGGEVDLAVTTGGTGLGPRDVTPEATLEVVERLVPGLAELMRWETRRYTPMAVLSRAVAGIRGRCLILNLPGSPRAVRQCLEAVLPVLPHALEILRGEEKGHPAG